MKGKWIHNLYARLLAAAYERHGSRVTWEHPVRRGRHAPAADFVADSPDGTRCAVEIETGARRVASGIQKADLLAADVALIVVPTERIVRLARRKAGDFLRQNGPVKPRICVMRFATALQWVADNSPMKSASFVLRTHGLGRDARVSSRRTQANLGGSTR